MNDIEEYEIEETEGGRQSAVDAIVIEPFSVKLNSPYGYLTADIGTNKERRIMNGTIGEATEKLTNSKNDVLFFGESEKVEVPVHWLKVL